MCKGGTSQGLFKIPSPSHYTGAFDLEFLFGHQTGEFELLEGIWALDDFFLPSNTGANQDYIDIMNDMISYYGI